MSDVTPPAGFGRLYAPEQLDAIDRHSAGLAEAARGNLDARVEHCPDWSVGDLVWHVLNVHWMWGTIAEERLPGRPDDSRRPVRPADDDLVDAFVAGARRLVDVLREADPTAPVWTWAPAQQDIAFIVRHQVQEAAVHHWDAANAAGHLAVVEPRVAADCVDEFLTFSLSSDADPADPPRPALDGTLALRATDTGHRWLLSDGSTPGTVRVDRLVEGGDGRAVPALEASAEDLLLWLYRRRDLDAGAVQPEVLARFRALTFTD